MLRVLIIGDFGLRGTDGPDRGGAEVLLANDAERALALVEASPPDLVLLDAQLDGASPELTTTLRARCGPQLPVLRFDSKEPTNQEKLSARMKALLDAAPDLILSLDLEGKIQFINRLLPQYELTDVLGSAWESYVHPSGHAAMARALESVLRTGNPVTYDVSTAGPDGSPRWFSSHIAPDRVDGHTVGTVIISRDVTERRASEAQLFAADRLAAVGTLAGGVAHEINNPLAAVIANLDLAIAAVSEAGQSPASADLREDLLAAREGAERLRTVVRDLKVFARARHDPTSLVDVGRVMDSTLRMSWNEIRHRATLVKRFDPVPPVEANEAQLGQIFLSLILNAAHAIPAGSTEVNEIQVSISLSEDDQVVVSVFDTGLGLSTEAQAAIFDPFLAAKHVGEGPGLGLSICRRLTAEMGGRLEFETALGGGSLFRVYLPASRSEPAALETDTGALPSKRRGRVLVVDDEPTLGRVISRVLSREHEVTVVTRALAALEMIAQGRDFDVILCDLMMPEVTGMDFHRRLQEQHSPLADRFIFMTGGAFTPAAREFLDRVPNLRIEKPFDPQQLRALVNDRVR